MVNSQRGEDALAARRAAEDELKRLDPRRYATVEQWLDNELYGGLYGHGGVEVLPFAHLSAIRSLLTARAEVYRCQKCGAISNEGSTTYDSEAGNERMAQAIDNCLVALGPGPKLPPGRAWDSFWPRW